MALSRGLTRFAIVALVLATYPAQAQTFDLRKELERLRGGGADATDAQTQAAPAAAASLRLGRAAFLDASRVAPPLTRLGAIVKPRVELNAQCLHELTGRFTGQAQRPGRLRV